MTSKAKISLEDCISFADFTPGGSMGSAEVVLSEGLLESWFALFPHDRACLPLMPEAMTSVLVMRAYMEILSPRPPGNVHAGQAFRMSGAVTAGETVTTEIVCEKKWQKNDRNWVELKSISRGAGGDIVFTGNMTMIWAV